MRITPSEFMSDPARFMKLAVTERIEISESGESPIVMERPESDDVLFYKISVGIPPEFADVLMDSVTEAVEPIYPGYTRVFSSFPVRGTWIPQEGSDPYDGRIGETTVADEIRIEFAVKKKDLTAALHTIKRVHPYEEPGIDVLPMMGWKGLIHL